MLHDEKAMDRIADKANKRSEDDLCGGVDFVRADEMMREYAEHQAAPLEARILVLEEALAVAHEAAIKADRKERGRIGNISGNELYAMFSNAPVEPHPLLADREAVL